MKILIGRLLRTALPIKQVNLEPKWSDEEQAYYFNHRNGMRNLPLLRPHHAVLTKLDGQRPLLFTITVLLPDLIWWKHLRVNNTGVTGATCWSQQGHPLRSARVSAGPLTRRIQSVPHRELLLDQTESKTSSWRGFVTLLTVGEGGCIVKQ